MGVSDRVRSVLRTVVPGLWASLLGWLASLGLPGWLLEPLGGVSEQTLVLVALAVVYPLLRWVEARLPRWLRLLLLGGSVEPEYPAVPVGSGRVA